MGKSSRLPIFLAAPVRMFCLGMLALLSFPCDSSVRATTFTLNGFTENSFHLVSNSSWIFNFTTGCLNFDRGASDLYATGTGRFLYPVLVQMMGPNSTTVKSFSTTFIYQIQVQSEFGFLGPGMAFIIVPDNITLGASQDYMGLLTEESLETAKNYESDNHTLGVELDTYTNAEFNDTNNNHIGIDLASMDSIYSFKPVYMLASKSTVLYYQIWIDYDEIDSRMDIYYANYKEGKPAEPQGSRRGLDLSLLKENMYIGFSTAHKLGSGNVAYVCAWSFSNDGIPAPSIVMAQDATPGTPPPPAQSTPPSPAPSTPPPSPAPSTPPPSPAPSTPPSPAPSTPPSPAPSTPPPAPSTPPPPALSTPPPPTPSTPLSPAPGGPNPPAPSESVPSQGPNSEPSTITKKGGKKKWVLVGALAGGLGPLVGIVGLCIYLSYPLRIFISHAGGPDGAGKNFAEWLHETMMRRFKWFNIKFFFDRENVDHGKLFPKKIFAELERFDVGLVIVTEDFFKGKWPMTELIAFVEAQKNDPTERLRLLPLFFELKPKHIKEPWRQRTWELDHWEKTSKDKHPLDVEKCREAVNWLCNARGIIYCYDKPDHQHKYIEETCKVVEKILREERSFAAYLRWAINMCSKCCRLKNDTGNPRR